MKILDLLLIPQIKLNFRPDRSTIVIFKALINKNKNASYLPLKVIEILVNIYNSKFL